MDAGPEKVATNVARDSDRQAAWYASTYLKQLSREKEIKSPLTGSFLTFNFHYDAQE